MLTQGGEEALESWVSASMLGYLANKRLQNLFQFLESCIASKISLAQVALLGEEGHTLFFLLFN